MKYDLRSSQFFACFLLHSGMLFGLLFKSEDGGAIFLRNVRYLSEDYMALYPRDTRKTLQLQTKMKWIHHCKVIYKNI
jgi:hypothetical protein